MKIISRKITTSWRPSLFLFVVAVFLSGACGPKGPEKEKEPVFSPTVTTRVRYVIDGDTLIIEGGEKIRFLGIDTPEIWKQQGDYPDQPWGRDAANYLTVLLRDKEVGLVFDSVERGVYGRKLAYVILGDELVNARLLKGGYARYKDYGTDLKYGDYLKKQERKARARGRGLWEGKGKLKPPRYFLASQNGRYYHDPQCEYAQKIRKENRFRVTEEEAQRLGLQACKYCLPASEN